jgi:serine/threonine protein phosphatase PrpC
MPAVPPPPSSPPQPAPSDEIVVQVFGRTDVGRTRDHNEDAFILADLTADVATVPTEVRRTIAGRKGSLFMVADGMGGAAAGEIASAMAVEAILGELRTTWVAGDTTEPEAFVRAIKQATKAANEKIHSYATAHPEYRGMGTTATIAGLLGETLYLAQVGDSRAYIVRNGVAKQITKDQSLMQKLIEAGELTEEEAKLSERRNIILQALGPEPYIKVDLTHQTVRRGDTLVLCSDGLSGQVTKDEIAMVVTDEGDVATACKLLVERANFNGGPDNITVIIARFDGAGLKAPTDADEIGHHEFPLPSDGTPTDAITVEMMPPSVMVRPGARPIHLGESTVPMPAPAPATPPKSHTPPPTPTVSPERQNTGKLLQLSLLSLLVVSVVYFLYRFISGLGKP